MCAAATIWLLPSASLGRGVGLERVDGALTGTTERLGAAVAGALAPVSDALQSTNAKAKAALEKTKQAGNRATRATTADPARQPALHGTNPHGQGGVAVVDLSPSNERPLGGNPDGSDAGPEDVVVGRARGEVTAAGTHHGHITILALFGNELAGVDSVEGETKNGPLQPLQTGVLDPLCTQTGQQLCLSVLTADSTTTATKSTNDFAILRAKALGLGVGAAESGGTIDDETKDCQLGAGGARTANVATTGGPVAGVANSATTSLSCKNQAAKTTSASQVIQLGNNGIPLPASGCADGTPDTVVDIPLLARIVCNADDVVGAAAVREALDVFVLNAGATSLLKETTASTEATSVAPTGGETGPQCSDYIDNDGDGVIDNADPGCHSDNNASNPASYVPGDTSEQDASPTTPSGDETGAECSDNVDNDGDKKVDERDPGCHSDGNPNNAASYEPGDDDEGDEGNQGGGAGGPTAQAGAPGGLNAGNLPLTGSNVIGLALAGLLVLAGGLLLRRREEAHPGA